MIDREKLAVALLAVKATVGGTPMLPAGVAAYVARHVPADLLLAAVRSDPPTVVHHFGPRPGAPQKPFEWHSHSHSNGSIETVPGPASMCASEWCRAASMVGGA